MRLCRSEPEGALVAVDPLTNNDGAVVKISIVTISFNQGLFLEDALLSVIGQRDSRTQVEYIVVDAGSTDATQQILDRYRTDIDYLIVEPDNGPSDGLNKGFSYATGDVLGFLNADDWLQPGALKVVEDSLSDNPDCGAVVGALEIVNELAGSRPRVRLPLPFTIERYVDYRTTILQQSTFFRRTAWEATKGFNVANRSSWDAELFQDMLVAGVTFCRTPQVLAGFRLHGHSISGANSMAQEYAADRDRNRARLHDGGLHTSGGTLRRIRRFGWRLRPLTRLKEFRQGLGHSAR